MYAVVVAWRQVDRGKLAALKDLRLLGIAAQQLLYAEAVTLGLKNAAVLDLAELADGAVSGAENGAGAIVQRPCVGLQGAGKEVVGG